MASKRNTPDFTAYLEFVRLWDEPEDDVIGEWSTAEGGYGYFNEDGSIDRLVEFQDVKTQQLLKGRRHRVKICKYRERPNNDSPSHHTNPMAYFSTC